MLVRPPEITTFRPAVDGSGEDAIVSAPDVHGVVQQAVVQHAVVQHAVVQQAADCAQHALDCTQQTVEVDPRSGALTGVGQHGCTADPAIALLRAFDARGASGRARRTEQRHDAQRGGEEQERRRND